MATRKPMRNPATGKKVKNRSDFLTDSKGKNALSENQEKFCLYYVYGAFGSEVEKGDESWRENFNAVEAYLAAGFVDQGSIDANRRQVLYLFRLAHVRKRIKELIDERNQQIVVDQLWVVKSLKDLARKSATDSVKVRALELLGKHLDLFTERHVLEDASAPAELAKAAFERSRARILKGNFGKREEQEDEQVGEM